MAQRVNQLECRIPYPVSVLGLASLLPIQLPASTFGEAEDFSSAWAPAIHTNVQRESRVGDTSLMQCWLLQPLGEWTSCPVHFPQLCLLSRWKTNKYFFKGVLPMCGALICPCSAIVLKARWHGGSLTYPVRLVLHFVISECSHSSLIHGSKEA